MSKFKTKVKGIVDDERFSSGALTAVIIVTLLIANIVVFVLAGNFGLLFTIEEKDPIVLSGNTDQLFEQAIADRKQVTISFCFPTRDYVERHDTGSFVLKTADEYAKRYPDFIKIQFVNMVTEKNQDGEDVDMSRYLKDQETGADNYFARATVIFECEEKYKVVTDTYSNAGFADFFTLDSSQNPTSYNGEAFMAAMINWVTVDEHPRVYLTKGHSEQLDRSLANLFTMAGMVASTVDLRREEVPADASLLVISNPVSDFERALAGTGARSEIERLKTYIERGGNIFVTLDPYARKLPVFEALLAEYGIAFSETMLDSGKSVRNIVKDTRNAITSDGFTLVTDYADNEIASAIGSTVTSYTDGSVILREVAALTLSQNALPMLVTTPTSTLEADGKTVDSKGSYCVAAYSEIEAKDGKTATLFVVPSIYAAVSDALVTNGYSNKDFIFSVFDHLFETDGMPYGCEVVRYDVNTLENLTMGTAKVYTALIMAVPLALAVVGTVVVVKRKNR